MATKQKISITIMTPGIQYFSIFILRLWNHLHVRAVREPPLHKDKKTMFFPLPHVFCLLSSVLCLPPLTYHPSPITSFFPSPLAPRLSFTHHPLPSTRSSFCLLFSVLCLPPLTHHPSPITSFFPSPLASRLSFTHHLFPLSSPHPSPLAESPTTPPQIPETT